MCVALVRRSSYVYEAPSASFLVLRIFRAPMEPSPHSLSDHWLELRYPPDASVHRRARALPCIELYRGRRIAVFEDQRLVAVAQDGARHLAMSLGPCWPQYDHSLGTRNVLLIVMVPDATNSNASECSSQGPMLQTPQ